MIIDTHTHIDIYQGEIISPEKRLENLKRDMKEAGVNKAIILTDIEAKSKVLKEEEISSLIEKEKDIFLAGTIKVTNYTQKDLDKLDRLLREKKIIAIKLYPGYEEFYPYEKKCDKIYNLCEKYNIPAIFHLGDTLENKKPIKYAHPIYVDEVAVKRPNMKIVMAHCGNPWIEDTMLIISRHPNVYADISGLFFGPAKQPLTKYLAEKIKMIVAWCGNADKLLFGTDWPCNEQLKQMKSMNENIKFVKSLKLSKEDEEKIFYKNAEKVFRI
ncbi:MAG: amidohydrolase family protein [Nanoarchaeota archaeon]|nr:amidohydrolase family protein [Nanoarchaeota archaeon]MBU1854914.1 amidohydrolase family protein [Nanoarchaeota archaeon]